MKVYQLQNKNQFIIEHEGVTFFQSYDSLIAKAKYDEVLKLGKDWDYSKTTLKHLYIFINDCMPLVKNYSVILEELEKSKNKRKTIQDLIDRNIIQYDNLME